MHRFLTKENLLRCCLCLVCWLCCAADSPHDNYVIAKKFLAKEQGLSSSEVFCVIQDNDGFMWFGTRNGLDRYDGKNILHVNQQKNGLAGNRVIHLAKDRSGRLILAYGHPGYSRRVGGLEVFDPKTHTVQRMKQAYPNMPFDPDYVYWVTNDGDDLCFLTAGPFQYWRLTAKGFELICTMSSWNQKNVATEALKTKHAAEHCQSGRYSLFTNRKASLFLNKQHAVYFVSGKQSVEKIINQNNRPIAITQHGSFLHDLHDITYQLDSNNQWQKATPIFPKTLFPNQAEVFINYSNKNEMLVTNKSAGLFLYDTFGFQKISTLKDLRLSASEGVYDYYTDKQGIHWIATANGILQVFVQRNPFTPYFSKAQLQDDGDNQVRGIYVNEQGIVYANVWSTLYRSQPSKRYPHHEILYGLWRHGLTMYSGSIYVNALQHETLRRLAEEKEKNEIWTIDSLNKDNLLLGCTQNILRFDLNSKTFRAPYYTKNTPPAAFVYRFIHQTNGRILAVAQNGLYQLNSTGDSVTQLYGGTQIGKAEGVGKFAFDNILDAYEDKDGSIWIATNGEGLIHWFPKDKRTLQYTTQQGLSSDILYRMEADNFQNLWISTDNGLMRFHKPTQRVKTYSVAHGLSHNEFNRTSSFKSVDGRLYFGGLNGVNAFYPQDFIADTLMLEEPIRITTYNQFSGKENKLLDYTHRLLHEKKIQLQPNDKFFNLEFQLLDYRDGAINYAYRIDHIDADWNYMKENTLRISGLPAGSYVLRIKGQGTDGQWSAQELTIPIEVLNPFYKRTGFIVCCVLGGLFLLVLAFRWRTRSLKLSKLALERTVNKRTEELKNSLDEKEVLLKEIHHRVKNNLEVISSLLELQSLGIQDPEAKAAVIAGQSRVHSIALIHHKLYQSDQVSQIEFRSFVQELFEQVKSVFMTRGTTVDLTIEGDDLNLPLDTAVPLGLILNELFTNSFKYAVRKGSQQHFTLQLAVPVNLESPFTLRYNDHGPGLALDFDITKSTSLGMKIIQLLSRQIGGELKLYHDNGTLFEISFYKQRKKET